MREGRVRKGRGRVRLDEVGLGLGRGRVRLDEVVWGRVDW